MFSGGSCINSLYVKGIVHPKLKTLSSSFTTFTKGDILKNVGNQIVDVAIDCFCFHTMRVYSYHQLSHF